MRTTHTTKSPYELTRLDIQMLQQAKAVLNAAGKPMSDFEYEIATDIDEPIYVKQIGSDELVVFDSTGAVLVS